MKIQLNRKFGKTFRPFMVNAEQDFCAITSGNGIESLVKKMLNVKDRSRYGNWYQPCPVSVTHFYTKKENCCKNLLTFHIPREEDMKLMYPWISVSYLVWL